METYLDSFGCFPSKVINSVHDSTIANAAIPIEGTLLVGVAFVVGAGVARTSAGVAGGAAATRRSFVGTPPGVLPLVGPSALPSW